MQPKLCTLELAPGAVRRVVAAAAVAFAVASAGATQPAEILPLAEVERGQRGEGWSVFAGDEPERFEVELLGVWRDISPDSSYVLARLEGRGLEESGVIAGMSGSPVYIDGRLVGAVAFSWPFAKEPIAGVTPIESMRAISAGGPGALQPATAGPPTGKVTMEDLVAFEGSEVQLRERLTAAMGPLAGTGAGTGVGTPERGRGLLWTTAGFGGRVTQLLEEVVGPVASAGRMESAEPGATALEGGSAVAAVLVDGDLRLAATGTVTERSGDTVLAFGHPFLGLGDIEVPMAEAEIVTVIPSIASSFKIGNLGRIVGAFDRDRPPGVSGTVGRETPMIPLEVKVDAGVERSYSMRLASVPAITGSLAATSVLGAIDTTIGAGGERSVALRASIEIADRRSLEIEQVFDGPVASLEAVVHLLNVIVYLQNNGLGEARLERIAVEIDVELERRAAQIVAAHASRPLLAPGETTRIHVELQPWRGESIRRSMEVTVPDDLETGRYFVLVGDGASIDAARLELEASVPRTLDQALEFLDGLESRQRLALLGVSPQAGWVVDGEPLARLPGSIRSLWRAPSGASKPIGAAVRQKASMDAGRPLAGLLRVDLDVRREPNWDASSAGRR